MPHLGCSHVGYIGVLQLPAKLYALSGRLDELPRGASRDEVIKAMKGKVLAKASLSAKV